MGNISDDLDAITVHVNSPDGRIEGRMKAMNSAAFRFRFNDYEDYYRHCDVSVLEHQLSRGSTLLATAYMKARRDVMTEYGMTPYSAAEPPYSRRHREYLKKGAELQAKGSSPRGEIRAATLALREFKVKIEPRVLQELDQPQFLMIANETVIDLRRNYATALKELRNELFVKYKDRER